MSAPSPTADNPLAVCDILLEAATPELYRNNAFRVLGLPVDATPREVTRRGEELALARRYGNGQACRKGAMPLEPEPDEAQVSAAIQRLRDPQRRLLDEFFWFWPAELGQGKSDPALRALAAGDLTASHRAWSEAEARSSEANVSAHNLAVLAHLQALDFEIASRTRELTAAEIDARDRAWQRAMERWKWLQDHEGFWSRLTARIRDLKDARLTAGTGRRFRDSLPLALLTIGAQLALAAAERGAVPETHRCRGIMARLGAAADLVDDALRRAVAPLRQRIKTICEAAKSEADADPTRAFRTAERLLEQTPPLLAVLDVVLGPAHATRNVARDEAALAVLHCQVVFGEKTQDWIACARLLERAIGMTAGEAARTRLEDNLKIVRGNAELGCDWCAAGYWELPRESIEALEAAREQVKAKQWDQAMAGLGPLAESQDPRLRRAARKALAYCLSLRAVQRLNQALDEWNQPLPTVRAALGRDTYRPALTDFLPGSPHCAVCGGRIYGQYTILTVDGRTFNLCAGHGEQARQERAQREVGIRAALRAADEDLRRARRMDPRNLLIEKNLVQVAELAAKLFGTGVDAALPAAQDTVCLIEERECPTVEPVCWFCGKTDGDDSLAVAVPLYGHVSRKPACRGKRIEWQAMKVKVPRCAGCKKAHDAAETMVWAGAGLSGIVCALVLAVVASVSAFAPVPVGVFVGWFVGFMFGINFGMAIGSIRLWKAGVLRVESTAQFGPVKQMRSEGWTVGEKPAGASLQEAARI